MIAILTKPSDQISLADINELTKRKVRESETLEFKETLPSQNQQPDPWMEGNGKIGRPAKKKILEESVAFANAYGGALVLGIVDHDGAAKSISPIPRCEKLARCLEDVFMDSVRPQLPRSEIVAIRTHDDYGVLVIRVPKSHLAPHRVELTRECPVRRSDRCEHMTMREIQDMTLNLQRGLQRVDETLKRRSELFSKEFEYLPTPTNAFGVRLTAIPVFADAIRIPGLTLTNGQLDPDYELPSQDVIRRCSGRNDRHRLVGVPLCYFRHLSRWEPRLRAVRAEESGPAFLPDGAISFKGYRELHTNGLLELGFLSVKTDTNKNRYTLHVELPVVEFANLVTWAHRVRAQAGAPATEYAIDVQIQATAPCQVRNAQASRPQDLGTFLTGSINFPHYSLGEPEAFPDLVETFERDFWNAFHNEIGNRQGSLSIDV